MNKERSRLTDSNRFDGSDSRCFEELRAERPVQTARASAVCERGALNDRFKLHYERCLRVRRAERPLKPQGASCTPSSLALTYITVRTPTSPPRLCSPTHLCERPLEKSLSSLPFLVSLAARFFPSLEETM